MGFLWSTRIRNAAFGFAPHQTVLRGGPVIWDP
jgi:hypothetical protein